MFINIGKLTDKNIISDNIIIITLLLTTFPYNLIDIDATLAISPIIFIGAIINTGLKYFLKYLNPFSLIPKHIANIKVIRDNATVVDNEPVGE